MRRPRDCGKSVPPRPAGRFPLNNKPILLSTSARGGKLVPCFLCFVGMWLWVPAAAIAAETRLDENHVRQKADAEALFRERVSPFIKTFCLECHSNRKPTEAGVSFTPALDTPGHAAFSDQWKRSGARVKAHDMPPEYADQPSDEEREMFMQWLGQLKFLSEQDPGPFVIRRLTKTEYATTLRDLFGVDPSIADQLPDEVGGEGYLNSFSPLQLEHYLEIANRVLDQALSPENAPPTEVQQRLLGDPPTDEKNSEPLAREVARSLARSAYRRPPAEAEVDVLMEVFELGIRSDLDYTQSLRLVLKAILVSPQFLCITPAESTDHSLVDAGTPKIIPLDHFQLASRLSYLLWATMPDDELMELADQGKLHDPAILESQVKRLLDDPRSRALFDGFGAQWLGIGELETKVFDAAKFPQVTDQLRSAMYDEARLFFDSILRENHSVVRFVDSDYTFLSESLAAIYGLQSSVTGPEMRKVQLSDPNRGGVLGMSAVLAATSFPDRTSPVKRGVWVLEQLLGDHVPSAPPDVPALEEQDQQLTAKLTLRERTELHRTNPVCANCHKLLDPIGFSLENFDAIGQWRQQDDNGEPIDSSGELPDGTLISGPRELKQLVAGRAEELSRNLVERLLAYALGRSLEGYDEIVVDDLVREIAADGYRMRTLVTAVVTSYPVTHRRIREE